MTFSSYWMASLNTESAASLCPDMDSEGTESVRVLTPSYPAEYGRKLGGVVEVTSDKTAAQGSHGYLEADGGNFDELSGAFRLSYAATQAQFLSVLPVFIRRATLILL